VLVVPMIVIYELGTRWISPEGSSVGGQVVAFTLMQRFFLMLGATGAMLPPLAIVVVLLCVHIARKDAWRVNPAVVVGMALESMALAIPLLALGVLAANRLTLIGMDGPAARLVVLSFGAGVYEEGVFRLGALTILSLLFGDVLRMPRRAAMVLAVVLSALLFASYHYLGFEAFNWRSMVFRTLAGIYFAILFVFRGFGITAFCHASYDIAVVAMRQIAAGAH